MKRISVSELKKAIVAVETERLKFRLPYRPERPKHFQIACPVVVFSAHKPHPPGPLVTV